jgi:potassium-transporting ATPase potassium-binding subunit
MTVNGWFQILLYFLLVIAVTIPMGAYMYRVFERRRTWLDPVLRPVERGIYAACGIDEHREQRWTGYAVSVLLFSVVGLVFTYLILRIQHQLPLNPEGFPAVPDDLSFNTAVSFTTNTNWQAYSGESTMSYLSQMMGLAFHNFVSAATGIAIAIAVIRGFARRSANEIGNFWVDLTRCTLWILLPIAFVGALVFVSQGMIQNLRGYVDITTFEGVTSRVPMGPPRNSSRCSAPTAAASSTPTPLTRCRTPAPSPTCCRWWRSSPFRRA